MTSKLRPIAIYQPATYSANEVGGGGGPAKLLIPGSTYVKNTASPPAKSITKSHVVKSMECGVAASYPSAATANTNGAGGPNGIMASEVRSERSPAKSGLHVNFIEKGEVKERREKFLTAKYGSHQMSLIRKRLAVEMWLFDELQKLYETPIDDTKSREVDVDIDELLDMDNDDQRRRHLQDLLIDAKKSPNDVKRFINDLLAKAKTL